MRSIRARLLILGAAWLTAALLAAFLFIAQLLEDFVTSRFDAETAAIADALIGMVEVDASGHGRMPTAPLDSRFDLPLSGWYWQVEVDGQTVARSTSLLDGRLQGPGGDFDGGRGRGADGAALRVMRREITVPGLDMPIAVTVTAPQAQIQASLHQIGRPLAAALIVLGLGLGLASVVQVSAGLRSLDRLGADLRRVRAGQAERLRTPDVSELRPLVAEINAALDQNAQLLQRSRQYLGNLAHSLKTPLAALANALPPDHPGQALIARMDRLIGWHLRRARSAQPRMLGQRSPIRPVIDDILLVLRRPMQDKGISAKIHCPGDLTFAGERQDLEEMIGNLTDNAVKWGRRHVRISAVRQRDMVRLSIADDGPGMDETDMPRALLRGARLDETGPPGAGLGLAIVAELATLHGGSLRLQNADLGGLEAVLELPA